MKNNTTTKFPVDRNEFPILQEKIMLSSCSQSALSLQVIQAFDDYKNSLLSNGMEWEEWMTIVESSRNLFAKLINCDPEEVAILASVSDCISSIINSIPFNEGESICVTDIDFPCIGHAALSNQTIRNVPVTFIPHQNYTIDIDQFEKLHTNSVKLTCVPHVNYYNGFKLDLKSISNIVHKNDSLLFVDAYQSAGSTKIDVKEMGIDILVSGMQKYLMGVPGIAFMYINKEVSSKLTPAVTGWFGQKNPFLFDLKHVDYAEATKRFNTGTPPVANAYIAERALQYILNIGIENIEGYLNELSEYTVKKAQELGFTIVSPIDTKLKGPTTALLIPNASKVEATLKERNIIVSSRQDVIRIAPHIYNTKDDIDHTLHQLEPFIS
ncbi:aminotransferase class V-fold PLP-dependent enzyme [Evansella sp. AB-rgal1]|uniref:aminotransferase class V-fold PLP-dependent enzyme n=1 Tax=Evansella sp. AB-rgal1 TaxID=3242696 RepID=UPI00359D25DB